MANNNMQYPTGLKYGVPRGSCRQVKEKGEFKPKHIVKMSPPSPQKAYSKTFFYRDYDTEDLAVEAAKKWRREQSDLLGLTTNRIQYLDKDTIKVDLTKGDFMETDAKFLNIFIDLFDKETRLHCDSKTREKIRKYAVYQKKSSQSKLLSKLLYDYNVIDYIDGNALNLRSCNVREFGSVVNKNTINIKITPKTKESTLEEDAEKQADYFEMKYDDLPKGIWLLGKKNKKPFHRKDEENIWTTRVDEKDENGKVIRTPSKTFNITKYKNSEEAYNEGVRWQIITSYKLNSTKNMIKIIDNDTIEVQLSKDKTMLTDKIFIPLVQKISLCVSTNKRKVVYAAYTYESITRQFHNLITGFSMVDHINGNTLDNRLCNLTMTTISINNNNRHEKGEKICPVKTRNRNNTTIYVSKIKLDKIEYSKEFSENAHGEEAIKLAEQFSKDIRDDGVFETSQFCNVPNFYKYKIEKFKQIKNLIKDNMLTKSKDYLPTVAMSDNLRKTLFMYYTIHYSKKYTEYQKKLQNITNKRYEMITNK